MGDVVVTYLAPCHGCHRSKAGCEQREDFRRRIKGIHARSVKFACPILGAEMRSGRRVLMRAKFVVPDTSDRYSAWEGEDCTAPLNADVPATILQVFPGYRFTSIVDDAAFDQAQWEEIKSSAQHPEKIRFRKRAPHTRIIRFLDEPDEAICQFGSILTDGKCDRNFCECSECNWRKPGMTLQTGGTWA